MSEEHQCIDFSWLFIQMRSSSKSATARFATWNSNPAKWHKDQIERRSKTLL